MQDQDTGKRFETPAESAKKMESIRVEDPEKFAKALAQFAMNVFKSKGISSADKNSVFSPISLAICLAMVYAGAANVTLLEMKNAMFSGK